MKGVFTFSTYLSRIFTISYKCSRDNNKEVEYMDIEYLYSDGNVSEGDEFSNFEFTDEISIDLNNGPPMSSDTK